MSATWMDSSHNFIDVVHGTIPYSGIESAIIENQIFSRLHRVFQSSLAYLTYPSNKVHRFEHSIGVMHLSGKFFYKTVCNSKKENLKTLFEEVETEIVKMLSSLPGEWQSRNLRKQIQDIEDEENGVVKAFRGETSDVFHIDLSSNILNCSLYIDNYPLNLPKEYKFHYYVVFQSIRLAGLLHDLGHLPYSHALEFSIQRLYKKVESLSKSEWNEERISKFRETMAPYCEQNSDESKKEIHEEIGKNLAKKIFEGVFSNLDSDNSDSSRPYILLYIAIVFSVTIKILKSLKSENDIFSDLHRIVAGVVDSDRMDYCCRDLLCAGLSKELPMYDRIFDTVQILYRGNIGREGERQRCYFAFTSKAIEEIDNLLSRRWNDFTEINYHHRVHKHGLLLELVVSDLAEREFKEEVDRGEKSKGVLPSRVDILWKAIEEISDKDKIVDRIMSQLDDEWLNTLLRYKYFQEYGTENSAENQYKDCKLWNRLHELITGRKHYYSLFKRYGGFQRFDDAFWFEFKKGLGSADVRSKLGQKEEGWKEDKDYIQYIEEKMKDRRNGGEFKNRDDGNEKCYFDYFLTKALKISKDKGSDGFYESVNEKLSDAIKKNELCRGNIVDCIFASNKFGLGFSVKESESYWIVSSKSRSQPTRLRDRSSIMNALEQKKSLFPSFHVYFLPKYAFRSQFEGDEGENMVNDLQKDIANIVANAMLEMITKA